MTEIDTSLEEKQVTPNGHKCTTYLWRIYWPGLYASTNQRGSVIFINIYKFTNFNV